MGWCEGGYSLLTPAVCVACRDGCAWHPHLPSSLALPTLLAAPPQLGTNDGSALAAMQPQLLQVRAQVAFRRRLGAWLFFSLGCCSVHCERCVAVMPQGLH